MSIRVAIFDDNATRRDGVKLLLDTSEGFLCAGAFENFNNGIADIHSCNPDVIIMDIDMPGINGIEAVRMIKTNYPQLPVMMQTVFDHDDKVFDSILAGASGYLLKKAAPLKLLEAIREIHEGGSTNDAGNRSKSIAFFQK
jgi:DNA-binding NarL/FixJ family response regulator